MGKIPLQQFTRKETCKANHHMTPTEYALWDVCMGLSRATRILYFDGRKLAGRFTGFTKSACYRTLQSLMLSGWFIPLEAGQRRTRGGTYAARSYKVLTHDEWISLHGTKKCFDTIPAGGTGNDNAFLWVADPTALQTAADALSAKIIRTRLDYWTWRWVPSSPRRTVRPSTLAATTRCSRWSIAAT